MDDVNVFVAGAIALNLERGDAVAQPLLELSLRTEGQRADVRRKTVGADDEVEVALARDAELDSHRIGLFPEGDDLIVEENLGRGIGRFEQQLRKVAPSKRDETASGQRVEGLCTESRQTLALAADDPEFANVVADRPEACGQPHALGDVVAEAPKVDHITACPEPRSTFDNRRLEARRIEPVCEGRPGDPGA